MVGPPGFEPGFAGLSGAPLQQVIISTSVDPQHPLEPAVLTKLHYGPTKARLDGEHKSLAGVEPVARTKRIKIDLEKFFHP